VEHGGLAAAGLAQHHDDLALGDVERQLVDRHQVAAAVGTAKHLGDVAKVDERIVETHGVTWPARTRVDSAGGNFRPPRCPAAPPARTARAAASTRWRPPCRTVAAGAGAD